jgi:hypothetical protein
MIFEHAVFSPLDVPEQRLALYTPLQEEDTPAKLARLLQGKNSSVPLSTR